MIRNSDERKFVAIFFDKICQNNFNCGSFFGLAQP